MLHFFCFTFSFHLCLPLNSPFCLWCWQYLWRHEITVLALLKDLVLWGVTAWYKSLGQDQEPCTHPLRCLARVPPFIWWHQDMCAFWKGDDGQSSSDPALLPNQLMVPLKRDPFPQGNIRCCGAGWFEHSSLPSNATFCSLTLLGNFGKAKYYCIFFCQWISFLLQDV